MRELWPSLETIQSRLAGDAPFAAPAASQANKPLAAPMELAPPPALVADLIARRVAAASLEVEPTPVEGQVVLIQRLAVLLDASDPDGQAWSGWLVSPDTDYAAWWDLLLDHRDEPFDPSADMVQAWNRVRVRVPPGCRVLAQLSAERLAMVRALAREFVVGRGDEACAPRPGFIAPRALVTGTMVLTGTPLGDARDPRRIYQSLYAEAANRIRADWGESNVLVLPPRKVEADREEEAWAAAALTAKPTRPLREVRWGKAAAWAALLIALALLFMYLARESGTDGSTSDAPADAVRESAERILSVRFADAAQGKRILDSFAERRLRVLEGPNTAGEYLVGLPARDSEQLAGLLRARGATVSAMKM